jgi:hypothetical protein
MQQPGNAPVPAPSPSQAKARILIPILAAVGALVVFLALFWHESGNGRKGHARHEAKYGNRDASHPRGGGSPVGGQDRGDEGNSEVTYGKKGGGAKGQGKGDAWWAPDGKRGESSQGKDNWWYEEKSGGSQSPVGGQADPEGSPVGGERPAEAGKANPESGPDDFWWRK